MKLDLYESLIFKNNGLEAQLLSLKSFDNLKATIFSNIQQLFYSFSKTVITLKIKHINLKMFFTYFSMFRKVGHEKLLQV